MVLITIVMGVYKPTYNWGGPQCMISLSCFLGVIPTLTHHSDIVSDMPSGSIYAIYILAFFLAYALAFYLTYFLASILTYFRAYILTFFLESILTYFLDLSGIYSDLLSGILSGNHSSILSDIYFDILPCIFLSGILSGMSSGPATLHSILS